MDKADVSIRFGFFHSFSRPLTPPRLGMVWVMGIWWHKKPKQFQCSLACHSRTLGPETFLRFAAVCVFGCPFCTIHHFHCSADVAFAAAVVMLFPFSIQIVYASSTKTEAVICLDKVSNNT